MFQKAKTARSLPIKDNDKDHYSDETGTVNRLLGIFHASG
jgi:hypothetical protein